MLEENTPNSLPLEPALTDAERLLRQSLTEACSMDPTRADTGEMIRLEETLAIAGEAAKRAVSLRRRMRQEGRGAPRATKSGTRARGATAEGPPAGSTRGEGRKSARAAAPADARAKDMPAPAAPTVPGLADAPPAAAGSAHGAQSHEAEASLVSQAASEHRTFRDARGVTWSVWAVHPQNAGTRRAGLRGTFVQGWLAFVCEAEKRRLSPVPDGWLEIDDAELERLCREAEVAKADAVTRRMPPIRTDES